MARPVSILLPQKALLRHEYGNMYDNEYFLDVGNITLFVPRYRTCVPIF
jgi:hypothetical protein